MSQLDPETQGKKRRERYVIWTVTGIYAVVMLALGSAWYSTQWVSGFHFFDDLAEWQQMDKLAHLCWTFHVSVLATRLVRWAGLDDPRAGRTGALMGFLLVSGIELFDGFSTAYGASVYDVAANAVGAMMFLAQQAVWKNIFVWPKFSFHPTSFAPLRPEVLGDGLLEEVLKDYNGQTFWYSVPIPKLPLPKWLHLAVGIGGEGMIYGRVFQNEAVQLHPERRYFISFDLNFSHVKTSSRPLQSLFYLINIIKVPAPALELSTRGIRFHAIYF